MPFLHWTPCPLANAGTARSSRHPTPWYPSTGSFPCWTYFHVLKTKSKPKNVSCLISYSKNLFPQDNPLHLLPTVSSSTLVLSGNQLDQAFPQHSSLRLSRSSVDPPLLLNFKQDFIKVIDSLSLIYFPHTTAWIHTVSRGPST